MTLNEYLLTQTPGSPGHQYLQSKIAQSIAGGDEKVNVCHCKLMGLLDALNNGAIPPQRRATDHKE